MQQNFEERISTVEPKHQQPNNDDIDTLQRDQHQQGDRVAKLLGERDTLLQTGVYTNDDPVIAELDREIRQMMAVGDT